MAGSVLSLQLLEAGYKVMVVDEPKLSSSSRVAAGIWNPVVFKRLTKSWMIDDVLPYMWQFYKVFQERWGVELVHERRIIKLFTEQQEADLWMNKSRSEMASYLNPEIIKESLMKGVIVTEAGMAHVLQAGNLNIPLFLKHTEDILAKSCALLEEKFNYSLFSPAEIMYNNIEAKAVIFCEGHLIKDNPWFNYLPMKPAKGEVLTLKFKKPIGIHKDILNKNAFLLPLGEDVYKAGATYNWNDLTDVPTLEGRSELTKKISKLSNEEYDVIRQEAGVRPSVIDRRPVLGEHPRFKGLYVFNGLGTKGVMLAPYFANQLTRHILFDENLNKDVDVARFKHFFVN